jgi:hypothetical protein
MCSETREAVLVRVKINRIGILYEVVLIGKDFFPFIRFCNNLKKFVIIIVVFKLL